MNVTLFQKVPVVITILNELWSVPAVRQFEHQHNSTEYLRVVDTMIELFKRLRAVDRAMEDNERDDQDESSECWGRCGDCCLAGCLASWPAVIVLNAYVAATRHPYCR